MSSHTWSLGFLILGLALSGCIAAGGGTGDPGPASPETHPEEQNEEIHFGENETQVQTMEGHITYSVNWPGVRTQSEGETSMSVNKELGVTGFVIELTWDPTTGLSQNLDLVVNQGMPQVIPPVPEPSDPVARATGESPLRIEIPAEDVDSPSFGVSVYATGNPGVGPVGIAVEQPFTLVVATFYEDPFVGNWTSL